MLGGRYRLVHQMGSGGFGRIWQAHDELLGTRVAAKELRAPVTLTDAERGNWLRRTERQVRWTAGLPSHPNLVAVHDLVVDGHSLWTVMELVEGQSLAARLAEQGPLHVQEAARVTTALLAALQAVHNKRFVHGAVCLDNVMLAGDRVVLLIDPEAAAHVGDYEDDAPAAVSGLIRQLECLAPERVQGLPPQPASDLYALGVTLYEAVEGISPFRGDSPAATLNAILNQPPPPMHRAWPLEPLIEGLLQKDPAARPTIPQAWDFLNPPATVREWVPQQAAPDPLPMHPPPITEAGGSGPLLVTAMLLLSLLTACVLLARPVLEYASSLAAASSWPAVLWKRRSGPPCWSSMTPASSRTATPRRVCRGST
ncbi:serine/threonine-protein kinase, partial [Streptomyces sp. NPDC051366]|uniref:serine/threonine-protein kinase n=1 Tax=Streptomyces sp. NPDC051366 TaxID=3365652 RepID=UPI0037A90E6F